MDVEVLFNNVISGNVSFFEETRGEHFNLKQVTDRGNSILHVGSKIWKVGDHEKGPWFATITFVYDKLQRQHCTTYCSNLRECWHDKATNNFCKRQRSWNESGATKDAKSREEYSTAWGYKKLSLWHCGVTNKGRPGLALFTNNAEESPLFLAVDLRFYKIALHILEAVPNCSYGGRKGMNVLHAAVINRPKIGKYLQLYL